MILPELSWVDKNGGADTVFNKTIDLIKRWWNDHNSGARSWDNILTNNLTSTGTTALKGTTTNDSAATGNVGEYLSGTASNVNFPTSTQFGDATSISLTAGDWDLTGIFYSQLNGAIITGGMQFAITPNSGNDGSNQTPGDNRANPPNPTATVDSGACIASYRVSIAGSTTYYLKYVATYTGGPPKFYGRLSARRVR